MERLDVDNEDEATAHWVERDKLFVPDENDFRLGGVEGGGETDCIYDSDCY